jgi:hypothetical protein
MRHISIAFAAALLLLTPGFAHAFGGAAAEFGKAGQFVPNGNVSLFYEHRQGAGSAATLTFDPSLLYFLDDHWAVGGSLIFETTASKGPDVTIFGLAPTVGYHLPINDDWTVLPQGSLYFKFYGGAADGNAVGIQLYAPFLYHIAEHFFLGIGPLMQVDLTNDAGRIFRLGGQSTVGGYF